MPVVNENDATATDEITFGDNDALAAQVAMLVRARLLVLLTEVEGVYSRAPGHAGRGADRPTARRRSTAEVGAGSALGKGGMGSKIVAAELAASAGIPTVIAGGAGADVLARSSPASRAAPGSRRTSRRRRRSSSGCVTASPSPAGCTSTQGARRALARGGASLLAVGVVELRGRASRPGDAVELVGPDGAAFAKGIADAAAVELAGRARGVEAVHRDRLVLYDRVV